MMDDTQYIRDRTDEILRAKIALNMTGGARKRKAAPKKKKAVKRGRMCVSSKSYRRVKAKKCPPGSRVRRAGSYHDGMYVDDSNYRYNMGEQYHNYGYGEGELMGGRRRRRRGGISDVPLYQDDLISVIPRQRAAGMHRQVGAGKKRKGAHTSDWIEFVKAYAYTHNVPYGVALKEASCEWRCR